MTTAVKAALDQAYEQSFEDAKKTGYEIMASMQDELDKDHVAEFTERIERTLIERGEHKSIIKRLFSIVIETLQNVRIHGERTPEGEHHSFVILGKNDKHYRVVTVNLAYQKHIDTIKKRLGQVNDFSPEDLKQHYLKVLSNGELSAKGGAGLGFITIAMKSKNPLSYHFEPINDELALFYLASQVDLKQKA